jgi:hypothetical protein
LLSPQRSQSVLPSATDWLQSSYSYYGSFALSVGIAGGLHWPGERNPDIAAYMPAHNRRVNSGSPEWLI